MKKYLMLGLALVLVVSVFALTGCGKAADNTSGDTEVADGTGEGSVDPAIQAIKDAGVLKVGVKSDVPGFGLLNPETGEFEGLEIDLAHKLAGLILDDETKVDFTPVTAETRGTLLDNGQIDMVIATFTIKPERKEQWNFSDPYYQDSVGLLVETKNGFTDLKSLDGKTIGVAQGATSKDAVQAEVDNLGTKVKFTEFQTYPEISAALKSGKVDAFSVDRSILAGYLDDERQILPDSFSPQDYGIATKKDNTGLADFVNKFVADVKANGEMDTLLAEYNLK
ncbi:MAG: transporter substrate-binding domain-containing protein [Actinomycetes bacterium]|jgi:putative glutamine transport system substrate-binding protein|nr:transporter substrate-binding domain-containing protein [Actinomycetes bacterium]